MEVLIKRLRNMADMRHIDRGYDAVDDIMREAADTLAAKDAELSRLRKALEPFSKFAGALFSRNFNSHDDVMELDPGDGDWIALSAGDFFEARRAFEGSFNAAPWTAEEWREICVKAEKEAEAAGLGTFDAARDAEIARLRAELQAIADNASEPQERYDRNGPTWTTSEGHEYEDTSAYLAKCNELAERARAALQEGSEP